ncbi:DUF6541 family protein [Kineococcus sp. SYSU DK002]|uniref:DUF6541 family protein n=1 Tax=Kineococcus sp. SYSU DK002 TaxID=3383123 RepID=UPI003D7DA05D
MTVVPITGGTPAGDVLTLAVATLWVLVPGAAVLLAAGVRRLPVLLGGAPAVSVGLSTLAATATGALGTRFGGGTVLVATALVAALAAVLRGRAGPPGDRPPRGPLPVTALVAAALALAAVGTTAELFRRGLGALATPSQEHDTITHTLVTARVLRTGDAAPWRAQAIDVITGDPAQYYPNGLHQWAALTAQAAGVDPVSGLNATSVVVLAVVQTLGLVALAARALPPAWLPAGGVAAVAAALAHQPLLAMHHDSGALPNAAAIAFAPGAIALLLPPDRPPAHRPWRAVAALVPVLALAAAGVLTVHPSAALTVGGGVLGAGTVLLLARTGRDRRHDLRHDLRWVAGLAGAAVLAGALVGTSLLRAAAAGGGSSSRFARDVPVQTLPDALHRVLTLPLQGGLDPDATRSQWWLAAAVVLGALLAGRAGAAVLGPWLVWSALAVAYLVGVTGPGVDLVWDSAWNSYYRVVAHGSPWAWLLAGVGLARVASWAAPRARPAVAAALGAALLAGTVLAAGPTEVAALRARYAAPEYERVDADDDAAGRFLAAHVRPGERVLNSGNDGSTYAYVLHGVPVLATTAVPLASQPDLRVLARDLRAMTPQVRALLREHRVGWVVVDSLAPGLPLRPADAEFFGVPGYAVPPGLTDLDAVPGLRRVFTSGSVGVWEVVGQGAVP